MRSLGLVGSAVGSCSVELGFSVNYGGGRERELRVPEEGGAGGGGGGAKMMISRGLFGLSPPHIQPLTPVSEVSEPPESPSPYLDMSAEGGATASGTAPVEADEEMEEPEENEPPPAAVPFSGLFACADRLDWALMAAGSLAAAAHGAALVIYLHYFAKIVQVLNLGHAAPRDEVFDRFKEVIS